MSYRRSRKKAIKDMFYPSYSLSYTPTWRQRKATVLQRSVSRVPEPPDPVIRKKDLQNAKQLLKRFNLYPDELRSKPFQLSVNIDADTQGSFDLNYETIRAGFVSQLGIDMSKVQTINVDNFVIVTPNAFSNFPQVGYNFHYGTYNATGSTAGTTLTSSLTIGVFESPIVYNDPYNVIIRLPNLYRNGSQQTSGYVGYGLLNVLQGSDLYNAYQEGIRDFPWFYYEKGKTPDFNYTELSIDNRSFSDSKILLINGFYTYSE